MELLARNERHRERERQAFTATIEIDAKRRAAVHKPPIEDAEGGVPLVTIDRQQPVPALDAAGGRSRLVDVRDKPSGVGRTDIPAGSLDHAVMPGDGLRS